MRIAIDLMGSDFGPPSLINGAHLALESDPGLECIFVGPRSALVGILADREQGKRVTVVEAATEILQSDSPEHAVRSRRDSSTLVALELVREKEADAIVTSANTGAVVLASAGVLGRSAGVNHPALATIITGRHHDGCVLLDSGATTVRDPKLALGFAQMGQGVAEILLGRRDPTVGLLSNGTEPRKGDAHTRESDELLAAVMPGYVGMVEPVALYSGQVDVVVTDGFIGNLVLKAIESAYGAVIGGLAHWASRAEPVGLFKQSVDEATAWMRRGPGLGGLLVGVNGVVVKCHGAVTDRLVAGSILLATSASRSELVDGIAQRFQT